MVYDPRNPYREQTQIAPKLRQLKVKKLRPEAQLPVYQTKGAAGFDVHAFANDTTNTVRHGKPVIFNTGLAFQVPEDRVMLAFSRSGMGFKHDLRLANCVGVIDSDYRGELFVKLAYDGNSEYRVQDQERVLQCVLIPVEQYELLLVDDLDPTDRGENGGGSTGKF